MSCYEYTDKHNRTLSITDRSVANREHILLGLQWSDVEGFIHILNADVPTVAAELLKAAGRDDLAALIESSAREAAEKAEAEAAEKKLQERRDALAKKYHGLHFVLVSEGGQRVINHIIELQDKLAGASRD